MAQCNSPTTHAQRIVIIGAGMAGTRFAMLLAEQSQSSESSLHITLLDSEPVCSYNRIMLSPVLAGEKAFDDTYLYSQEDFAKHGITVRTQCSVQRVDTAAKTVRTADGDTLHYDQLVFATGSHARRLPMAHADAAGVFTFRTKDDVDSMLQLAQQSRENLSNNNATQDTAPKTALVIGAGLLGLEAANALKKQGMDVCVVHSRSYVLNRQLDETAAQMLQAHFDAMGIRFLFNARSQAVLVDDANHVTGLELADGRCVDADCIVLSVGVQPNIALAQDAGLACGKGILVDDQMRTDTPDVYAIGECIEFDGALFGLVAPAYEQAQVLASHLLAAEDAEPFALQPTATKLKVSGVNLFSAGDLTPNPDYEYITYDDPAKQVYRRYALLDNRIANCVMYGEVGDGAWAFDLMLSQADVSAIRPFLGFGKAFCKALDADTPESTDNDSITDANQAEKPSEESKEKVLTA